MLTMDGNRRPECCSFANCCLFSPLPLVHCRYHSLPARVLVIVPKTLLGFQVLNPLSLMKMKIHKYVNVLKVFLHAGLCIQYILRRYFLTMRTGKLEPAHARAHPSHIRSCKSSGWKRKWLFCCMKICFDAIKIESFFGNLDVCANRVLREMRKHLRCLNGLLLHSKMKFYR